MIETQLKDALLTWVQNVDFATSVNLFLSGLSVLLVILSLIFVLITLRQNNKILAAESRPYIPTYSFSSQKM